MFNPHNTDASQPMEGTAGEYHPERIEAAEFTMRGASEPQASETQADATDPRPESQVFDREQIDRRREEWEDLQAGFIDDPHRTVEYADRMISEAIDDVARSLTRERERLREEWEDADDASTEDLRVSFQRYRRLLDRLLSL